MKNERVTHQKSNKLSFSKDVIGNLQRLSFSQAYGNSEGVKDPRTLRAATSSGMTTLLNNTPSSVLTGHLPPHGEAAHFNALSTLRERAECVSTGMRGIFTEEALNKNTFRAPLRAGFTLMELLVVVLIIGILAAVALPQYQKAIEKSRATEALLTLKTAFQSMESYYLTHGSWPQNLTDLDIQFNTPNQNNWSYQIKHQHSGSSQVYAIEAKRLTGNYAGAGFRIHEKYDFSTKVPLRHLVCLEYIATIATAGSYCQQIFKGKYLVSGSAIRYYSLP